MHLFCFEVKNYPNLPR